MHEKANLIVIRLFCRPIFRSSGQRGSAVGEVELSHTFTGFSQWHDINLVVGNGWALRHIVLSFSAKKRQRDNAKCYNQRNATRRRDKQTGLSTVFYKYSNSVDIFLFYQCFSCNQMSHNESSRQFLFNRVSAKRHLTIDTVPVTLLDIHLECDKVKYVELVPILIVTNCL